MDERIAALAAANGWRYEVEGTPPALGAGLWEQVSGGVARDKVAGDGWETGTITGGERRASEVKQVGGFTVTTTVSVSTPVHSLRVGYLAMTLPRRLPHLVLDATSNGRELLQRPSRDQRLSLEGDFDRHFRLYAPSGYERDALYVFTPDLMALLIDETGDLDVEVRDDRLIVLRPGGFDLTDPATWARFERIRETVGRKAWSQTDLYRDDRAMLTFERPGAVPDDGAGVVAEGGRRLRRRVPRMVWFGIAVAAAALVFAATVLTIVLTQVGRAFG